MTKVDLLNGDTWYRAGEPLPQALVRCRHGMDPECECIRRLNIDKSCPLSEREASIIAAKFEFDRLTRLNTYDDIEYEILKQILSVEEAKKNIYIDIYKLIYGPLLPREPIHNSKPILPPPPQTQSPNILQNKLLLLMLLPIILALLYVYLL